VYSSVAPSGALLAAQALEEHPAAGTAGHHHDQDDPALAQHEAQRRGVAAGHPDQEALHAAVEEVRLRVVLQQQAAHHRRQRQRDEAGDDHRPRQRQREFDEEPPGAPRREGQRCKHRGQGHRHRQHREADLAHALQCRLERRHQVAAAFLDVAEDVLQHDDRVVDDEADGQHQRQQGQRVDGEARRRHQGEGADQAHGDRHQRNDGRAQRAQEHEHHQRHQPHGLGNRRVDGLHRAVDEDRVVVGDAHGQARRQVLLHRRQHLAHAGGNIERVGGGIADHARRDRRRAVQAHALALAGSGLLDAGHVAQPHGEAVDHLQRHFGELALRVEVRARSDVEFALLAFDAAGRHFQVLAAQRVFHVLRRQPVGGQPVGVEPDAHRVLALAEDRHVGHARNRLQPWLDDAVDDVGDLQRRHRFAGECDPDHREGIGLDLGDDRFVGSVGQPPSHARDPIAHIGRG
jgi:hypothetical protein